MKERFKLWWKQFTCIHSFIVEHQDDACSVEVCEHCDKMIIYGD